MLLGEKYIKALKKRASESKVYRKFQLDGLEIAQILGDTKRKSLYIKLAKERGGDELRALALRIGENKNVRNKGAYFMFCLSQARGKTRKKKK